MPAGAARWAITSVVGPSGVGSSALLKILACR
ncbi:ABC-type nitrate/sulfonate/bicarbonate transport system ATPase subunit [Amycolatopsis thermophila]|uniref:ABC-type nitrate/sulfonate/bicarbonate transport system ATPase subunit n=1 Tax=Amycolatopsis thermophila TaxID=206084 RepID=A0ABU0EZM7_9PSEU|nr:ABC-type nitrate/sulfonate/bicarbonate transport system ATPase subunit [Amycolatopsis thermophila]